MKIGKLKSKFESFNLTSIIKSIKFYSRNNIAVRGHPDKNALNSGDIWKESENLRYLINFQIDPGDKILANDLHT